jgi:hypothetical protein
MQIVSSTRNGSGNYYLVSSNMTNITDAIIYTVSNLTVPPISVVTLTGLTAGIGSIVYDSVNLDFYASGKDGILYASDLTGAPTALTWTAVNTPLDNLKLGPMNIVDIGGTDYLLIGSDGGFYEMELPLGTPVSPTSTTIGVTEYLSIDLYMNTIFTILGDGSDAFYIGSSNGLWYSDTISIDLK